MDATIKQVQERDRQLQEVTDQLATAQQALQARSEEAERLGKAAEEAAAALAALQSDTAAAAEEKSEAIKSLQVRAASHPS
jgi:uncharacterized protein YpuA (DUF1002 family)